METLIKVGAIILKTIFEAIRAESGEDISDAELMLRLVKEMDSTKKDAKAIKDESRAIAEGRG